MFKRIFFIFIYLKLFSKHKDFQFNDLNFKKIDFSNYKQIKSLVFKNNFYSLKNLYIQSFDFLNFSKNLGGKIGINLSRKNIFSWYKINKNKIYYPWSEDLIAKRLINLIYNYEFINSSSNKKDSKLLNKIILVHIHRVIYEFNNKRFSEINSYEIKAIVLSYLLMGKLTKRIIDRIEKILSYQIDTLGVHKSYNILEHSKCLNNLSETKDIFLFFNDAVPSNIDLNITKMTSMLIQYFHLDGSIPLFNGSNNNYTKLISNSLNNNEFLKSRKFSDTINGLAYYADKNKKIIFDVVQPNKEIISKNLSAGTLSFELSSDGEKIITNCGASESVGSNPEYLRYSAAHSTIILQNTNISEIKEKNPHIKFPQSVLFSSEEKNNFISLEGSHNGYQKRFNKILKRRLLINKQENEVSGEDSIISLKETKNRIIFHIRFHLMVGISFNFTNNKKNLILRTKKNNMWLFKSDSELSVENSIFVDYNKIQEIKQIVIKGAITTSKQIKKWSIKKL